MAKPEAPTPPKPPVPPGAVDTDAVTPAEAEVRAKQELLDEHGVLPDGSGQPSEN